MIIERHPGNLSSVRYWGCKKWVFGNEAESVKGNWMLLFTQKKTLSALQGSLSRKKTGKQCTHFEWSVLVVKVL